ncbi:MAG: hypothetical protein ABI823_21370 [Bryobacteraceae bacterium]
MSAVRGDTSRFHRLRKKKIARRMKTRELKAEIAAKAEANAAAKKA